MLKSTKLLVNLIGVLFTKLSNLNFRTIIEHFLMLHHQLNPVPEATAVSIHSVTRVRCHNLFAILVLQYAVLYGIFGHHYAATGEWISNAIAWSTSPYIATHQVVPRAVWPQFDWAYGLDVVMSFGILSQLLLNQELNKNWMIAYDAEKGCLRYGAQVVDSAESAPFMAFFTKVQQLLTIFIVIFHFSCTVIFLISVWHSSVYTLSIMCGLYWIVGFPLALFYIIHSFFFASYYVITVCRFIEMEQRRLIVCLERLHQSRHNWSRFMMLNSRLLKLCQLIRRYSRHCRPLLSILFPYFIGAQGYMLYSSLFMPMPPSLRRLLALIVLELNLFMAALIRECAQLVKLNGRIGKLSRRLVFRFAMNNNNPSELQRQRSFQALIKMEMFQSSHRLHPYAFQLWSHYRITSKTFFVILLYICTFFIFISKNQNSYHDSAKY